MPRAPLIGQSNKQFSTFPVRRIVFWLVAVTTLVNANHLLNMMIGTGWPATLGLAFCCTFLCLTVRLPLRHVLGTSGSLIVASLASYLFIGLSTALVVGAPLDHPADSSLPFRVGVAIVTLMAVAFGAALTLLRVGIEALLKGILAILTVTCILILATPLLMDHILTSLPERWHPLSYTSRSRFAGTFTSSTAASTVACYAAALALSFLTYGQHRIFATMALSLACAATILTTSRAGFISLGVVFLSFLIPMASQYRRKRIFFLMWIVLPSVVSGIVWTVVTRARLAGLQGSLSARSRWFFDFDTPDVSGETMYSRFALWPLSLSRIAESPLFGHGIAQFHRLEGAPICQIDLPCGSHNSFLMLWGEAGILPLTLLVLGIGSLLWTCWRLPRSVATSSVTGWTLCFSLACMARDSVPYLVWNSFIIGLSCALMAHATRESHRQQRGSSKTQRTSPQTKFDNATPPVMG